VKIVQYFFRIVFRFSILWLVDVASLLVTALIIPGILFESVGETPVLVVAVAAALLMGVVNLFVRPLLLLLALPFGFFALFVVGFFVNTITINITAALLPGFIITGWVAAFFGGLVMALVNTLITSILTIDDDDQFYQGLVERIAARQSFPQAKRAQRGLVMIEIDGLSYHHMQKAIQDGWMPTVAALMEDGYVLSQVECGLPSQTSACQAGILFGDNYDIPGFRWYDKSAGRLMVSGREAALLNERYARGQGLLRGGSSINNMLTGDAQKSMLTLANLSAGDAAERRRRAQDIYLVLLNPYFLMRTLVLFVGDMLLEIWQSTRQRLRNEQPRLNRLAHFYPLLRAFTTVFLRDVAAYLLVLDIIRGSPAIYMTWPGYDEVAHHSGPWSRDAFNVLRKFDMVIARVCDILRRKAPLDYEFILLSDHGQSFGATFQQRYGYTLSEFIEQNLPLGTEVMISAGGDDGTLAVKAMAAEIENIQEQGVGGRVGKRVVRQTNRVLAKSTARQDAEDARLAAPGVIVCGSGNLAQVYFDLAPRKLTLPELDQAYPGLVDTLVNHAGIGFVVGYNANLTPVVLGKQGQRNLHTGEVRGIDPLLPYDKPNLRGVQVRRLADFPTSGDLIINSTLYPDGTVAAMEELIGNHGGLGGEQTEAFLFHPPDLRVPPTQNAIDLFPVLDSRRRLQDPVYTPEADRKHTKSVNEWSNRALIEGLRRFETWITMALHALWLDRRAYQAATHDPYMTSPALLIVILMTTLSGFLGSVSPGSPGLYWETFFLRLALWPALVLLMYATGQMLGGHGTYTQTLRGMGFAQVVTSIQILELVPVLMPVARVATLALFVIATWIGVNEAHHLSGWRVWVVPFAALLVLTGGLGAIGLLLSGAAYTATSLLGDLGFLSGR
jgi:uncharacterized membrane protein YvlD (DUF360 family)